MKQDESLTGDDLELEMDNPPCGRFATIPECTDYAELALRSAS